MAYDQTCDTLTLVELPTQLFVDQKVRPLWFSCSLASYVKANSGPMIAKVPVPVVSQAVSFTGEGTHASPQSHLHDLNGLYSPLVSKLSMPGYVIEGVASPRQPSSLLSDQQVSPLRLLYRNERLTGTAHRRRWSPGLGWRTGFQC
jgi:hypothetical protein